MDDETTNKIVDGLWRSIINNSDDAKKISIAVSACHSMGTYLPNKLAIRYLTDLASGRRDFASSWATELSKAAAEAMAKRSYNK